MNYQNNRKCIFLFSKDRDIIQLLRNKVVYLRSDVTLYLKKTSLNYSKSESIIIIDTRFYKNIEEFLEYFNDTVICLTDNFSGKHIENLFRNGVRHVLTLPINTSLLLCLIKRYLGDINISSSKLYKYRGITICRDSSYIEYNECRVFLTRKELEVLESLISLENKKRKHNKSFQVTISRINNKTREGIGLRIIKNRYGQGYYISI